MSLTTENDVATAKLSLEDYMCPICLELVYKPVVIPCGHTFCFWCIFQSLDPFTKSKCPICRTIYTHSPKVCVLLQSLVQSAFPELYEERKKSEEIKKLEEAVSRRVLSTSQFNTPRILVSPTPERTLSNGTESSIISRVATSGPILQTSHVLQTSNSQSINPDMAQQSTGDEPVDVPGATSELAAREVSSNLALNIAEISSEEDINDDTYENVLHRSIATSFGLPELDSSNEEMCHYNVGCDGCGMYPMIGKRFHCQDCPEAVGFDLCETCFNEGFHRTGVFNQQHTADHRMVEYRPVIPIQNMSNRGLSQQLETLLRGSIGF